MEKVFKATELKTETWFDRKNSWFTALTIRTDILAEIVEQTEKAIKVRLFRETKVLGTNEWFTWIPKSAILNNALLA